MYHDVWIAVITICMAITTQSSDLVVGLGETITGVRNTSTTKNYADLQTILAQGERNELDQMDSVVLGRRFVARSGIAHKFMVVRLLHDSETGLVFACAFPLNYIP